MKLSLIIPAYNEEKRIPRTLKLYYDFFKNQLSDDFEFIVVINNSKDNTLNVVNEFSKNKKNIRIANFPFYTGKGGAVIKGFKLARGDFVGFVDADNSITPENFYKIFDIIKNNRAHGVIASRAIKGAVVYPRRKGSSVIASFVFNKLANILFGF
jgi:glycosyltransferase involved in cell wall biosynthesis